MELRDFAEQVLCHADLAVKLTPPETAWTDEGPGPAVTLPTPARGPGLEVVARRHGPNMPAAGRFREVPQRALAHCIMANHELQALEVMAGMLLRFPAAPAEFRQGLAQIMVDEQQHTRMHIGRAETLGLTFGSQPVNSYIWLKSLEFESPLDYLAGLPLTFEGRNLDHTLEFAALFESVGDARSATLMRKIHDDEIEHVRFGIEWLRRLKPAGMSDWEAYRQHLKWPLRPEKSIGKSFNRASRRSAGLDEEFITQLESLSLLADE